MLEIIPGILEKEWGEIEKKIELFKSFVKVESTSNVAEANAAPAIHIDIIDGKFGQNTTFIDPTPFSKYTKDIFFELHMMVENPIQYLKRFSDVGFRRFLGHIEKMPDQAEFVASGQLLGEVGLVIDGPTQLSAVKVPYSDLDCILVMTIKAGESGQTFVPEYLTKVEILRFSQNDIGIPIEVDGGINSETIVQAKNAGATRFVANSFIFESTNPEAQFNLLRKW